jgi:TRAP-type C4-dicarboxylate transport system permease small subunit
MKKTLAKYSSVATGVLFPVLVMAQTINDGYLVRIVELVQRYLNIIAALIIALAFIYFLWGLLSLVTSAGDKGQRADALNKIGMGIVVLAVMVSVWGLVRILTGFFGVDSSGQTIPQPPVITLPR